MWVLIFYLGISSGGGPAVIEGFTDKTNCEIAAIALKTKLDGNKIKTLCIQKN